MPTLGEELRHRREQRNITLAEISEATRIGTRFLKAIETDNFSILPGGIFTRSFIRAYAKHVGMNEDEAVSLYLQQVSGVSPDQKEPSDEPVVQKPAVERVKPPPPHTPSEKPAPVETPRRYEPVAFKQSAPRTSWSTVVIGAGIVIFIVIIVVALVKQLNQGADESEPSAVTAEQNATSSSPRQTQPATPATQQPSSQAPPSADGQPLVVQIEAATGDSWVRYQVDDAKPTTLVLKQGQSQDLPPAQTQITLNYGNRLTLKLKINNREANFPPDTPKFASQVVISRDNFQTYFQ